MILFTYGYGHSVREVPGSRHGRGTIVGGVFHVARQLARLSPPNMPYIRNLFRISPRGEAINYISYMRLPDLRLPATLKIGITAIIIIIIIPMLVS